MSAAGAGLAGDDPEGFAVEIDFPRSRLAVDKIESAIPDLAPPERPDLAATTARVVEKMDDVRLCRSPSDPVEPHVTEGRHELS